MKRIFAAVLVAAACVVGSTPSFARGAAGHGLGGGFVRNPTTLLGASPPPSPTFENRVPAPLAAPSQPPVINGPSGRSPYGGVM
jgi:hypothetical protein